MFILTEKRSVCSRQQELEQLMFMVWVITEISRSYRVTSSKVL